MNTNKSPLGIVVFGAAGRMGRLLLEKIIVANDLQLVAAIERADHPDIGSDIGTLLHLPATGILLTAELHRYERQAVVGIDFSHPAGLIQHLDQARAARLPMVIGTTGLDQAAAAALDAAARDLPILYAANFSLGVAVLSALVTEAARILGPRADIEISETHHRDKIDAPSGTALTLGEAAANGLGSSLKALGSGQRGDIAGPRSDGNIGFASLRGGSVAGDHTVMFLAEGERLELTHRAEHRGIFAEGALAAARWIVNQPTGRYTFHHMLGL